MPALFLFYKNILKGKERHMKIYNKVIIPKGLGNTQDDKLFSQEDLDKAYQEGYDKGYADGKNA